MPLVAKVNIVTKDGIIKKGEALENLTSEDMTMLVKHKYASMEADTFTEFEPEDNLSLGLTALKKMKKDDLTDYALSIGMDVDISLNKEQLIESIGSFMEGQE